MAKYIDYTNQPDNRIVYDKSPTQGIPSGALNYQPPISREYSQSGDLRSISIPQTRQQSMTSTNSSFDIDSLADKQFDIGKKFIENEYSKANHEALLGGSANTAEAEVYLNNAKMIHDMKMQELMTKYQKYKTISSQANKDPTLSQEDVFLHRQKLLESQPIFEIPQRIQSQVGRSIFTPAQIQKGLGDIALEDDKDWAIQKAIETFGPNYEQIVPQVKEFIDQKFQEETEQVQKTKNIKTPKPISYPNATWNSKYNMWTIIENGKLVGLQEE
jgi:hypothetical protein